MERVLINPEVTEFSLRERTGANPDTLSWGEVTGAEGGRQNKSHYPELDGVSGGNNKK